MLSKTRSVAVLILISSLSCSSGQSVKKTSGVDERVKIFLSACERDLANASKVIAEQDLVKNLSHLNRMGNGGSHYYELEKESLTKMLNQLSTYPYSECIVINSSNRIVYSMYNDAFLGKSSLNYPGSPIHALFTRSIKGEASMTDVSTFPQNSGLHEFYFSMPIKKDGVIQGVIIASIDVKYMVKNIPEVHSIIDTAGIYKYHNQKEKIFTEDELYLTHVEEARKLGLLSTKESSFEYHPFTYKELSWYIIIKH